MNNNIFDVWVMLIAGVVGYFLNKVKIPTSPAILGLILGPMAEKNFRTALLKSSGNPNVFFNTVICWFFLILIFLTIFGGPIKNAITSKKKASKASKAAK
jgi:putative tricarboxylic transport membrane protein